MRTNKSGFCTFPIIDQMFFRMLIEVQQDWLSFGMI